jgi:cobalt-zinc-cadmium efflux system membrane fusion protein
MTDTIRSAIGSILSLLPVVITLGALGGLGYWGYRNDWKAPSLGVLLGRVDVEKKDEGEKSEKPEESARDQLAAEDKPLHLVKLASAEVMETAQIKAVPVEEQDIPEHVTANGEILFNQKRYAHLSSRAPGSVWSVEKHEGDEVKKGDVLALISCPEVGTLKIELQQALVENEYRKHELDRLEKGERGIAQHELHDARFFLRKAQNQIRSYQQSLLNLGLSIHSEELAALNDKQIALKLLTLGIPDSLLQRLDAAKLTNNLLPMYAPFDGVVTRRDLVIGEVVNTTMPLFDVADLQELWLMLNVRAEDIHKVRLGQDVRFAIDADAQDTPTAKIDWISTQADEKTRTVLVRGVVPNPQGRLRPFTFGTGRIVIGQNRRVTVPNEALQWDGHSHLVFVQGEKPTEFQPARVRLGTRHEKFTEILSGVKAGQLIATSGSHVLLSEMLKERISGDD